MSTLQIIVYSLLYVASLIGVWMLAVQRARSQMRQFDAGRDFVGERLSDCDPAETAQLRKTLASRKYEASDLVRYADVYLASDVEPVIERFSHLEIQLAKARNVIASASKQGAVDEA
jgi:hypothetical protein